jgi:hypothetical protein
LKRRIEKPVARSGIDSGSIVEQQDGHLRVMTALSYPLFPIWALFSVIFLAAFAWNARATSPSLIAIGAQSSSVIVMVASLCNGYEGLLLVSVAAELAWQTARTVGLIWVIVQSVALGAAMAYHWSSIQPALLLAVPYLGFQLLMFAAVRLFVEERKTRRRLEDLGGTLSATSLPAGGFAVRAELPCAKKSAA